MKILPFLAILFIVGCATITLTEKEAAMCKGNVMCLTEALDQKTYQAKHDAEARRIERREHIVAEIQRCFDSGNVILETKHSGSIIGKPLRDRHGVIHLPRNAHIQDYRCGTSGQIAGNLRRDGLL